MDACLLCMFVCMFEPRDWLGRTSPRRPILCRVKCKTTTQSSVCSVDTWCELSFRSPNRPFHSTKGNFRLLDRYANSSCGGTIITIVCLSLCLSVFPHEISNTDATRITKLDTMEMFYHESQKPIFCRQKVKVQSHESQKAVLVWVFALLWVLAFSGLYCFAVHYEVDVIC